jgi:hypothetical protein
VSFQLQADTGRGIERKRAEFITPDAFWKQIEIGAKTSINHTAIQTGHPACNRYGMCLVVNDIVYDLFDDPVFVGKLHAATANIVADRNKPLNTAGKFLICLIKHPYYFLQITRWCRKKLKYLAKPLFAARGQATTLSFFVHNFMDACALEPDRIKTCVFKAMTIEGPVSMCLHNADRDKYILKPVPVGTENNYWHPLTGLVSECPGHTRTSATYYPLKKLKGRIRQAVLKTRQKSMVSQT